MTLQETTEEKDLGVVVDSTVKPTTHMAHAVMKANQLLGIIRKTFTYMDCNLNRRLYASIVRPHLEYASIVWHPYVKKATMMVPGLAKMSSEERLRKMDLLYDNTSITEGHEVTLLIPTSLNAV